MKVIFGTDSIKYPLTGIGRYAYELAKCLSKSSEISELLFLKGRTLSQTLPDVIEHRYPTEGLKNHLRKSRFAGEVYRLTAPWLKTQVLRQHKDAIYHGPNFYLPPKVERCVVTFHDLSVFTWPQCHPVERVKFMQKELMQTLKRAQIFITDSEFTRRELIKYFNLPENKVYVARLASSGDFHPALDSEIAPVLNKYQLNINQYCLFTGSIEPRKNITTLLEAYQLLPTKLRRHIPLVISGFKGWCSDELHHRFERGEREGWLRYLGYTPTSDLPSLFAGARSFVFPSLYEGFGLPVLEAMASGVPVVCSTSSSLPEVVGDCALTCEAMDVDMLTGLIQRSIEDNIWREQASAKGLNRSSQFSWQRCAQETISAYMQVK
ncbi:glycosyltransferase family 1 protein [Atlantibacter subterranea]|uniref:Glycosyltransferase family 1 protein n=1 Tax=Atlantibacter subterraneus TaxID=255519 RepID=A0A427V9G4_9ENTR|nr:glycosyltransferase family 1 protein [Atlantibacter subterranea]MDA3133964.1 glycosyltransferase family 1 protein [Atlantibacter subterranea]RSB64553.1 glycosyltransferase family 1 protein [Atlantibacter subterranea]RSE07658.1 glycosyltransferase family 1 protein [Atlantibacter subterranea]RSE29357.1 glycosyltransferase family 1 protein [Atlantibacter subterranea]